MTLNAGAVSSLCCVSAGDRDGAEQRGPAVPEAPPPSYPLILDRDPVPEEMVRSDVPRC